MQVKIHNVACLYGYLIICMSHHLNSCTIKEIMLHGSLFYVGVIRYNYKRPSIELTRFSMVHFTQYQNTQEEAYGDCW